jgi:UDP-N-acetylmuramyl pentapeptide synthase
MELPDRRQKEAEWHGYAAIDDSYNISLTTARAGVEAAVALAKREGKKLLVVTAGIPELGPAEKIGNEKLGELIASRADHAAILKSIFAGEIIKGIRSYEKIIARNGENFSVFDDLSVFSAKAPAQFPSDGWAVLVQPELTDLYY